ncbi:MAG: hypothetical protein FLDDKLPJ_00959 [Phycisphaerae bacterium]|nr:hypothetical protein [Phycisphaerae bacterium]
MLGRCSGMLKDEITQTARGLCLIFGWLVAIAGGCALGGFVLMLLGGSVTADPVVILTVTLALVATALELVWARDLFPPRGGRRVEAERRATRILLGATIGLMCGIALQFVAADFVSLGSSMPVFLGRIALVVGTAVLGGWMIHRRHPVIEPSAPLCDQCGYNLTGLVERRCPECGEPFRTVAPWER